MSRGATGSKKTARSGLGTTISLSAGAILVLVSLLAGFCLYTVVSLPSSAGRPGQTPAAPPVGAPGQAPDQLGALINEMRASEQQFSREQKAASVLRFEESGKNLLTLAQGLKKNGSQANDPKGGQPARIAPLVSRYTSSFRELVQAYETRGITGDAGIRQKLALAAKNIAPAAAPVGKNQALEQALMQLGRAEQNYFAARGVENQRLLNQAAASLAKAVSESGRPAAEQQVLAKSINSYTSAFDRYLAVSLATSDKTLASTFAAEQVKQEEAMHKAALEMEKVISGQSAAQTATVVQTLRQQEEEYLAKGTPDSASRINTTLEEYGKNVDKAPITPTEKTALKKAAAEYQAAFTALMEQDKKIAAARAEVEKSFAALQAMHKPASAKPVPPVAEKMSVPSLSPQLSLMIIAGAWLFIVLLTLLLARMLGGAVSSPIQRMTDTARRMTVQGDFSQTFAQEKNEFAALAGALNELLQRQAASRSSSDAETIDLQAKSEKLAARLKDRAEHDHRLGEAVAGQGEALARIRGAVAQIGVDAGNLRQRIDGMTEYGKSVRESAAGCEQAVTATVESVNSLVHSSGQLTTVINDFTDLAEQTSVKALNAAIKATRTGARGQEFSQVTEELDRLAKRAGETARGISQLVSTLAAGITAGEKTGAAARQALQQLAATSETGLQAIDEIDHTATSLQTGSGDCEALLTGLDEICGRTESLVQELQPLNQAMTDVLSALDVPNAAAEPETNASDEPGWTPDFSKVLTDLEAGSVDHESQKG